MKKLSNKLIGFLKFEIEKKRRYADSIPQLPKSIHFNINSLKNEKVFGARVPAYNEKRFHENRIIL